MMSATAATTPITMPAIAPPDKPTEELLLVVLVVLAAVASDGELAGVDEETDVDDGEVVDADVDVEVGVAVEVEAIVEVSAFEIIIFSGMISKAKNVLLAFFLQEVHEYPPMESQVASR